MTSSGLQPIIGLVFVNKLVLVVQKSLSKEEAMIQKKVDNRR
ncbi:hypothetical protein SAMN04488130_10115 [Flavobacterium urumqiense]|uniref:Uncharacterized protein n=1 Tax=Flavobacterium urumqiense TaxID=935224 RepID=A0A1H5RTN0_9FLAO|nr:hypothetical protein SAMN04488130_10115 [Flavobacterium urumqiense]